MPYLYKIKAKNHFDAAVIEEILIKNKLIYTEDTVSNSHHAPVPSRTRGTDKHPRRSNRSWRPYSLDEIVTIWGICRAHVDLNARQILRKVPFKCTHGMVCRVRRGGTPTQQKNPQRFEGMSVPGTTSAADAIPGWDD